jgi:hypothetical protein
VRRATQSQAPTGAERNGSGDRCRDHPREPPVGRYDKPAATCLASSGSITERRLAVLSLGGLPTFPAVPDHARPQTKRPKSAYKVVLACLARLERDQATIAASRADLARDCGITPQEVSVVMGELAEARIVAVRRIGRRAVYTMNPSVAWRGREAAHLAEVRDFEPAE